MARVLLSSTPPEGFCCPEGTTQSFIPLPETGLGTWMNQSSATHYLPSQKIGRGTWMATWRTRDFSLRWWKSRKSRVQCRTMGLTQICTISPATFHTVLSSSAAESWSPTISLSVSLSLWLFWLSPKNSSQWWTVCSVWKDWSFIKPLLSIKKMKCSPGLHHLEPSLPPSLTFFHSVTLLWLPLLHSIALLCASLT